MTINHKDTNFSGSQSVTQDKLFLNQAKKLGALNAVLIFIRHLYSASNIKDCTCDSDFLVARNFAIMDACFVSAVWAFYCGGVCRIYYYGSGDSCLSTNLKRFLQSVTATNSHRKKKLSAMTN